MNKSKLKELKSPSDYRYLKKRNEELYDEILQKTSFLGEGEKLVARVYCLRNNITSQPLCPECKSNLDWDGKNKAEFKKFCCVKCASNSNEVKDKKKKTCVKKYGTTHHMKSDIIKQKLKNTVISKYGVDNVSQYDEFRQKFDDTISKRTFEDREIINEKRKNTCLETYGSDHISKLEKTKQSVRNTIETKYGVTNAFLTENARRNYKNWYSEKYQEVIEKLNNPDWLIHQHHTKNQTIKDISDSLGVSNTTVCNYFRMHDVLIKHNTSSNGENELYTFISDNYDGLILQNDRNIIKPKELDIVLPELKIAIEYCGLYWHSSNKLDKNYHYNKLNLSNMNGYRLITIFEDEWIEHKEIVQEKILNIIKVSKSTKIFARKCEVKIINTGMRKTFLNKHHIQGNGPGSIIYGLFHDASLVSVMTFKNRSSGIYELNRFASSCNVVGGFSKMLSHFKKNHEWNEIISFADRRWSEGNVYYKTGFELVDTQKPDYSYFVNGKREHKFNFRKDRLGKILKIYDDSLSESENTHKNGLYQIYNCGLLKFSMKNSKHDK
jgi:hypothetical protein